MKKSIGLLPCGAAKKEGLWPAGYIYIGSLFKMARQYAELYCDDWIVVNTKYGPVYKGQLINSYDDYLGKHPKSEWRDWFDTYRQDFDMMFQDFGGPDNIRIISLLTAPFALYLEPYLVSCGYDLELPVKGLSIGYRQEFFAKAIQVKKRKALFEL